MLAFFRRALSSWFLLGFLGIVLMAMLVTGIGTPTTAGSLVGANSATLAKVGGRTIDSNAFQRRMLNILDEARQKQPGLTMEQLIKLGAADSVLTQMIDQAAIIEYAEQSGLAASKQLIDRTIANTATFNGVNGKFSQERYQQFLEQSKLSDDEYRDQIRQDLIIQQLTSNLDRPASVPQSLILPYASMGLETRQGAVGAIPASSFASGAAPSDAEITAFYNANKGRYTVQETRVIKYAVFDRTRFDGKVAPAEQDIAAYYKLNATKFAKKEKRGLSQVIVPSQGVAEKIAEVARGNATLSAAAKTAGLDALAIAPLDQTSFASQSSEAVAKCDSPGQVGFGLACDQNRFGGHHSRKDA
jgi:peptidyl-prolyl cis-trans isomerase D